jgi:hypothetical protein
MQHYNYDLYKVERQELLEKAARRQQAYHFLAELAQKFYPSGKQKRKRH